MTTDAKYESIPGLVASTDLSSSQYKLVKFASTAGQVKLATAKTDKIIGALQNDPTSGAEADVAFSGICKVISGGSVTVGTLLTSNSTAQVADSSAANDRVVGYALEANSTATNLIRIVINCATNF